MVVMSLSVDPERFAMMVSIPALSSKKEREIVSAGMMMDTLDSVEERFEQMFRVKNGESATLTLPLQSYRRLLGQMNREHGVRTYIESGGVLIKGRIPEDQALEELRFSWNGAPDCAFKELPGLPDQLVRLGGFQLEGARMRIIDPCYEDPKDGMDIEAQSGGWTAWALLRDDHERGFGNGMMVARLGAHRDDQKMDALEASWRELEPAGSMGVDSGTLGFFDPSAMPQGAERSAWFDTAQARLSGPESGGANPYGAATLGDEKGCLSRTFLGDGSYPLRARFDEKGQAVSLCVNFDRLDPSIEPDAPLSQEELPESEPVEPAMRLRLRERPARRPLRAARKKW